MSQMQKLGQFVLAIVMLLQVPTTIQGEEGKNRKSPVSSNFNLFNPPSCLEKPWQCPHPKYKFFLFTRSTKEKGEQLNVLDGDSLLKTQWNTKHKTKLLIHGFNGGREITPTPEIKDAYLAYGEYNVIVVDYGESVREPCLSQLHWAPRFGALCISQLLKYLNNHPYGVRLRDLHVIGCSMGAHVSGLLANYLSKEDGKIGRITGLDPFIIFTNLSNETHRGLDKTDADFVDVIHTSAGTIGQWNPTGHADFYVNGGTDQITCPGNVFARIGCNHNTLAVYFIESINSSTGFWAGPCPTLISYLFGMCKPKESQLVLMGEHINHGARGVFYITTNAKPPYARGKPGRNGSSMVDGNRQERQKYDGVRK